MDRKTVSRGDHVIALAVAGSLVALAFAHGGHGPQARAIASIGAWWLVAAGALAGVIPRAPIPRAGKALLALLAALTLLTGISLGWAADPGTGFEGVTLVALYLALTTLALLTLTRAAAGAWLRGIGIGLTLVALVALGSRFFPGTFVDHLATSLPSTRARLSYPIGYWNALGLAMATAILVLTWIASAGPSRTSRSVAFALIPAPALALYLTSSRGAVLALAVGCVVLLAFERRRLAFSASIVLAAVATLPVIAVASTRSAFADGMRGPAARGQARDVLLVLLAACAGAAAVRVVGDRAMARLSARRLDPRLAGTGVGCAIAIVVAAAIALDPAARLETFREPPAPPQATAASQVTDHLLSGGSSGRYQLWSTAWDAFAAHPVQGLGAGGYEAWWAREGSLSSFVRNAHSLPLETLAELGLPGGLLLVGLAAVVATAAIRRRRDDAEPDLLPVAIAVAGCGAVAASIDWMWQVPVAFAPVLIAAALVTGLPASPSRPPTPRRGRWPAVAAGGAGVLGLLLAALVLAGDLKVEHSRAAVRAGDLDAAARDAADAATLQPWSAAPRLQLALVEERRGDLRAATRSIGDAIDKAPESWRIWLVAARLRLAAGDVGGARRAATRVRCLYPRIAFPPEGALPFRRVTMRRESECRRDG